MARWKAHDEWQGYDPDFDPISSTGFAETLPVREPKGKILARNAKRKKRSFVVRGFHG